jgi:hypothetical protein
MRARNDNTQSLRRSSMSCRGLLPEFSCCWREEALSLMGIMGSLERLSGRTAAAGGSGKFTPSTIMSPATSIRPSTEIRLGVVLARKLTAATTKSPRVLRERGPPKRASLGSENRVPAFDAWVLYR